MAVALGKSDFQARLRRIEQGAAGRAKVVRPAEGARPQRPRGAPPRRTAGLASLPVALGLGVVSLVAARLAIFRFGGLPEQFATPDYELAAQVGLALGVVMLLALLFKLMRKRHLLASVLGVGLAVSAMHNLVHVLPGPWVRLFSPQWVNEIQTTTEPNTLEFRGARYRLG